MAFLDLDATIFFQYIAAKEEPPAEFKDRTQMQADINKRVSSELNYQARSYHRAAI